MEKDSLNGLVQIFWGSGKGKTTAALGIAVRALGSGMSVHIVQFMKNGSETLNEQTTGEINALQKFNNFTFKRFGLGQWYIEGKNDSAHKEEVNQAFQHLMEALNKSNYDIIIADEILYAVQFGLLEKQALIKLIKNKPKNKELILTGSHIALPEIFAHADLISEIKKVKHPFDSGILARKGIDF